MEDLKDSIYDALMQAKDNLSSLHAEIEGEHIIIFVGNTRSGKSTLINYILKNKLIAYELRKGVYKIEKADESAPGPQIGQGTLSKTAIPGLYHWPGYVIIDAPGFDDNRGEAQGIINALYINQIRHCQTCKFVLVSDISNVVCDNVGSFLSFINKVNELIPDTEILKISTSLVLTKDNMDYTQQEIAARIREEIIKNKDLKICDADRELIDCFAKKEDLIAIFPMPTCKGPLAEEIDVNIKGAIAATSPSSLKGYKVGFVVSSEVRLTLYSFCEDFIDKLSFEEELNRLVIKLGDCCTADYFFASTKEELLEIKTNLSNLVDKLQEQGMLTELRALLGAVIDLGEVDIAGEFYKMMTLFAMLDEAALMNPKFKESLIEKYKRSLWETRCKIKHLKTAVCNEEERRINMAKANVIMTIASTTAMVAGAAAAGFAETTLATGAVALASTGIGGVLIVGGMALGGAATFAKKKLLERMKKARQQQGRPVS